MRRTFPLRPGFLSIVIALFLGAATGTGRSSILQDMVGREAFDEIAGHVARQAESKRS